MGAAILLRADFDTEGLRGLPRQGKHAAQARRLLALGAIYERGSRSDAVRLGNGTLQVVRDWVLRFNANGPEGLIDGKAPGPRSRLNDVQRAALAKAIERGLGRFSCLGEPTDAEPGAAALIMPWCDTHAMTQHLAEIARHVDEDAHAVLIHGSTRLAHVQQSRRA